MIPYVSFGPWHLGPFTIYPFGIMVGLAILVGAAVAQRRAEKLGINPQLFSEAVIWLFVGAFVMAHWVSVLLYFPERVWRDPLELLKLWKGISSFGGFLGGAIALIYYVKWKGLPFWTSLDAIAYGLSVGWIFGRGGCSLAHDHPGKCTNFPLAVKFPGWGLPCPEGYAARHDLGFYEFLFTIALASSVVLLNRKKRFTGFTLGYMCLVYAPVRFLFDFLRIGDRLYWGLTPGQYFSMAVFGAGIFIFVKRYNAPHEAFVPYNPETGEGGVLMAGGTSKPEKDGSEEDEPDKDGSKKNGAEKDDDSTGKAQGIEEVEEQETVGESEDGKEDEKPLQNGKDDKKE